MQEIYRNKNEHHRHVDEYYSLVQNDPEEKQNCFLGEIQDE